MTVSCDARLSAWELSGHFSWETMSGARFLCAVSGCFRWVNLFAGGVIFYGKILGR